MEKLFEKATRKKLRFETSKGNISVEELWEMPLQSRDNFDLDTVAKKVNKALKESAEESFVTTSTSKNAITELKLEILKYIISVKKEEEATKKAAAENKAKKERILELIEQKKDQELSGKSLEELTALAQSLSE